jgi:hypothetical protein
VACGTSGCTWYFEGSIERVVYLFPGGKEMVQYKTNYYLLKPAERMANLVAEQLSLGNAVHVGGKHVSVHEADQQFHAYPFIDISTTEDREAYELSRRAKT